MGREFAGESDEDEVVCGKEEEVVGGSRWSPGKCLGQGGLWKRSRQRQKQIHSEAWVSNMCYKCTRNSPGVLKTPSSKNMSALWNQQDWGHGE